MTAKWTESIDPSAFERLMTIDRFWEDNYDQLLNLYCEEFVAVQVDSGEIVAHSSTLPDTLNALEVLGIPVQGNIVIQFVSPARRALML